MDVSIVVPLYNEEENIPALYERVAAALAGHDFSWELILVDDGSGDHSCLILREIAAQDSRVKVIRFRRNFGQTAAMAAVWPKLRRNRMTLTRESCAAISLRMRQEWSPEPSSTRISSQEKS